MKFLFSCSYKRAYKLAKSLFVWMLAIAIAIARAIAIAIVMTTTSILMPSIGLAQSRVNGGLNLPTLGDTERGNLSPIMERKLGEQIMRDIRRDRDYLDDAPLLEYLNNFGASLAAARVKDADETTQDFSFFAVRDQTLNAFALPGGFIGVHSALILAAQNESELASVMAHEIGHVVQRHIARMLGQQSQDALIPLASVLLAVLASRGSPDASMTLLAGGQGLALQRQLNFSRDAEREADRIGLQILQNANVDASGMVGFFGRMQAATRSYTDNAPSFLRSHPLTTERIADIQERIRDFSHSEQIEIDGPFTSTRASRFMRPERPIRVDSLDFHLIQARVRVLQDSSQQGLYDAKSIFDNQLLNNNNKTQKNPIQITAAQYGLAYIALKQREFTKAQTLLQEARTTANSAQLKSDGEASNASNPLFSSLAIEIKLAAKQWASALQEAESAHTQFPLSRGIARQYAEAMMAAGRYDEAVRYLRDQIQSYRDEQPLYTQLAESYAAQGKRALQHLTLAESYALAGSLPAALEQLSIARQSSDASYYDQALIDAREREWKARRLDEMKESQQQGH